MNIILTIVLIIIVFFLFVKASELMKYKSQKSAENKKNEQNLLPEFMNLKSIKINVIPAGELYRYILGGYMVLIAYCIVSSVIFCLATGITSFFTGSHGIFNPLGILVVSSMIVGICTPFFILIFWRYAFFRKAIAPNLKYGDLILQRIGRYVKYFSFCVFIAILVVSSLPLHDLSQQDYYRGIFISAFSILLIFSVIFNFFLRMEVERLGIPNLWDGIKNLMKDNQETKA